MDSQTVEMPTRSFQLSGTFLVLSVLYVIGTIIHRLYFHPLHKIPGPWINAVSRIPYARHIIKGTTHDNVKALHERYGEVVRLSPNEVSFISGETAWQDIYGFRTGKLKGHESMQKDPAWYAPPPTGTHIILANDADHSRMRKTLAHAFSEKALAKQEVLLQDYVDQLINGIKEVVSRDNSPQDMTKWYNWTTFDIIADLLFGEPFGCLQDLSTHKYITLLFNRLKSFRMTYVMYYWPWTKLLRNLLLDQSLLRDGKNFYLWVGQQTKKRVERDTQRPDFMTEILKHNGEKGAELSPDEIRNNASVMIAAGSETTATLLSGVTYLLCKNPGVHKKLKDEIRGRFKKADEITIHEVNNSPYLLAVLSEALRYFPPVPTGFQRRVGKGGEFVSGHYVSEGTALSVSQWPLGHSESMFKDADLFVPERWMGDARYADDYRDAVQPFSFGPRNCLGKNLAYAEMRLILAKMIWTFDLELDPCSTNWISGCKVLTLWEKPELLVHVKEVDHSSS